MIVLKLVLFQLAFYLRMKEWMKYLVFRKFCLNTAYVTGTQLRNGD